MKFTEQEKSQLRYLARKSITGKKLTEEEFLFLYDLYHKDPEGYNSIYDPIRKEEHDRLENFFS